MSLSHYRSFAFWQGSEAKHKESVSHEIGYLYTDKALAHYATLNLCIRHLPIFLFKAKVIKPV
jgi:hypothetical protein